MLYNEIMDNTEQDALILADEEQDALIAADEEPDPLIAADEEPNTNNCYHKMSKMFTEINWGNSMSRCNRCNKRVIASYPVTTCTGCGFSFNHHYKPKTFMRYTNKIALLERTTYFLYPSKKQTIICDNCDKNIILSYPTTICTGCGFSVPKEKIPEPEPTFIHDNMPIIRKKGQSNIRPNLYREDYKKII